MEEQYIDIQRGQRYYELALARFKQDKQLGERNKEIVCSFLRDAALGKTVLRRRKKKIGPARLLTYITHLYPLLRFTKKDLDKVTQEDMERFIDALETDKIRSESPRVQGRRTMRSGGRLSLRYKVDIKVTVRKFYKWLWGESKVYPKIVEWIDTYCEEKEISALTEAEVERMIDRAKTPRQRAIIQVLFDGGFRIGELLNIRLHHVLLRNFDPDTISRKCFQVRIPFSKTLRRTVALPMPATTKWLSMWLEDHPAQPTIRPDGTIDARNMMMQLFPISDVVVRRAVREAGRLSLGKRVYPHLLRHTSATYWCNKLPYFMLCKRFGWTMTSDMPQRYIDREGVDELKVVQLYGEQRRPSRDEIELPVVQDKAE